MKIQQVEDGKMALRHRAKFILEETTNGFRIMKDADMMNLSVGLIVANPTLYLKRRQGTYVSYKGGKVEANFE